MLLAELKWINMMKLQRRQFGLTLIEMMIAMLIGLIVMAATMGIFLISLKSNVDTLKMVRLNQELQAASTIMSRDFRRAGYWGTPATANAYAAETNTAIANCILFAYDVESDGLAGGAMDYIGYKWVDDGLGASGNEGHLEIKVSAADFDVCTGTGWSPITDNTVVLISQPTFTVDSVTVGSATFISIEIILTGILKDDEDVSRTITEKIRLRNDIVI